jgi:D-erythronate 2-dehydrogenase
MKLLITGGSGFLGSLLARELLHQGELGGQPLERLLLVDQAVPPADLLVDPRVQCRVGPLLEVLAQLNLAEFDGVFHLASAVSGECEADFELGLRSNLESTRALLEAVRAGRNVPRFVFASSAAVFGGDPPWLPLPAVVRDDTLPTPQTSYGTHKFVCEQLIADYTRKGFLDGRSVRLLTVSVRPGRPNGAASGFLSGIIREPLAGIATRCPVAPETAVALASPARTLQALLSVFRAEREVFGGRSALNLPALTVRVADMLDALERVAGPEARALVRLETDPTVDRIVRTWPATFDSARAKRLGLNPDPDFESVVRAYVTDHPGAVKVPVRA